MGLVDSFKKRGKSIRKTLCYAIFVGSLIFPAYSSIALEKHRIEYPTRQELEKRVKEDFTGNTELTEDMIKTIVETELGELEVYKHSDNLCRKPENLEDMTSIYSDSGVIFHPRTLNVDESREEAYYGEGEFFAVTPDALSLGYYDAEEIERLRGGKIKACEVKKTEGIGYVRLGKVERIVVSKNQFQLVYGRYGNLVDFGIPLKLEDKWVKVYLDPEYAPEEIESEAVIGFRSAREEEIKKYFNLFEKLLRAFGERIELDGKSKPAY